MPATQAETRLSTTILFCGTTSAGSAPGDKFGERLVFALINGP